MAQEKIEILFKPRGSKKLLEALKSLDNANKKLAKSQHLVTQRVSSNTSAVLANSNAITRAKAAIALYRNTLLLAAFAAGLVTKALVAQVKAFAKQEASVMRLASVFGGQAAVALDKYSSILQQNSTFGDENINMVMSQIGAFGASEEQTKELTKATLDLAAGLNLDLNTAGLLVAKTIGSTTDALTRYGVGAGGATDKSKRIENVIESINIKFGGLAKILSQTTEGQLAQAANAFGDFQEQLGSAFTPIILSAAKALKFLAESMSPRLIRVLTGSIVLLTAAYVGNSLALGTRIGVAYLDVKALYAQAGGVGVLSGAYKVLNVLIVRSYKLALKNPYTALAMGALVAAGAIYELFQSGKDQVELYDKLGRKIKSQNELELERAISISDNLESLREELALLDAKTEAEKAAIKLKRELTDQELELYEAIELKNKAKKTEIDLDKQQEKLRVKVLNTLMQTNQARMKELKILLNAQKVQMEQIRLEIELQEKLRKNYASTHQVKIDAIKAQIQQDKKYMKWLSDMLYSKIAAANKQISKDPSSWFQFSTYTDIMDILGNDVVYLGLFNALIKTKDGIKQLERELLGFDAKPTEESIEALREQMLAFGYSIEYTNKVIAELESDMFEAKVRKILDGIQLMSETIGLWLSNVQATTAAEVAIIEEAEKQKIEAFRKSNQYRFMSEEGRAKKEDEIRKKEQKKKEKLQKRQNKLMAAQFRLQQAMSIGEIVINYHGAIAMAMKQTGIFGKAWVPFFYAMEAASIAAVLAQKPPKAERGGYIGGRRHSQGGTLIEAEQGEFIMSRDAVNSVGLETMNRINQGGGGAINVNFTGNVLSSDFIEEEAIPQIRDAIRRGADIGVG